MAKAIGIGPGFVIVALVSTPLIAKSSSLEGNWVWSEHISPGDSSIRRLEFLGNHKVAGLSYLPDVFSGLSSGGRGEVLESDAYGYKLSSKEIVFTTENGFGSGWPSRYGVKGRTQKCGFSFGPTRDHFMLSKCDLAGDWRLMPRE